MLLRRGEPSPAEPAKRASIRTAVANIPREIAWSLAKIPPRIPVRGVRLAINSHTSREMLPQREQQNARLVAGEHNVNIRTSKNPYLSPSTFFVAGATALSVPPAILATLGKFVRDVLSLFFAMAAAFDPGRR